MGRWNKERLVRDVKTAAAAYPPEKLAAMWDYKCDIMKMIVAANRGNDYERHRS